MTISVVTSLLVLMNVRLSFINIPPSGSTGEVDLVSRTHIVKSSPEWADVEINDRTVRITVSPNYDDCTREGVIELAGLFSKINISLVQKSLCVHAPEGINYGNSLPATDALGRRLPDYSEVGSCKERYVAMFYWIWHRWHNNNQVQHPAVIPSQVIAEHPEAATDYDHPAWPAQKMSYYWGEPLWGFYLGTDEWVLLRHAQMLADAGVDVIVFDATNHTLTFDDTWPTLCETFLKAREQGIMAPKIAFHLPFAANEYTYHSLVHLYESLYKPGRYSELFFLWEGKPLIMGHPEVLDKPRPDGSIPEINEEIKQYFTFRPGHGSYIKAQKKQNTWGWLQISPQHTFGQKDGRPEEMPVGVAQNHYDGNLVAMNTPGAFGRSYTKAKGYSEDPLDTARGLNFQEQWDEAIRQDPTLVFVTGWNEWIMGRAREWQGQANAFPDEFDQEHSRDIEPMAGGHSDNYYYQLVANIRRFKGMMHRPRTRAKASITIDGSFSDWWNVDNEYRDPIGDTMHRNHEGWGGVRYVDNSGRNDIVLSKVAEDDEYLFFYVACSDVITPYTDPAWMRLLIDVDSDWRTGWNGYDFILNRVSPTNGWAIIESNEGGWSWTPVAKVKYHLAGREMELAVPKSILGIGDSPVNISFKWSDNMQRDGEITDFLISGDTAPIGRFNYVYEN